MELSIEMIEDETNDLQRAVDVLSDDRIAAMSKTVEDYRIAVLAKLLAIIQEAA